jgi:hypothetical protein
MAFFCKRGVRVEAHMRVVLQSAIEHGYIVVTVVGQVEIDLYYITIDKLLKKFNIHEKVEKREIKPQLTPYNLSLRD